MAEVGTPADFERWVEPHLTTLTRYAARQVADTDRDDVVRRSLMPMTERNKPAIKPRGAEKVRPDIIT